MRVVLAEEQEFNPTLAEDILDGIVVIGFITGQSGTGGNIEVVARQCGRIAHGARSQKEFNRLSAFGNQNMHAYAIEKALFTGDAPSPCLGLLEFTAWDAVVIAGGNRVAVQDMLERSLSSFQYPPSERKRVRNNSAIRCKWRLKRLLLNKCGM